MIWVNIRVTYFASSLTSEESLTERPWFDKFTLHRPSRAVQRDILRRRRSSRSYCLYTCDVATRTEAQRPRRPDKLIKFTFRTSDRRKRPAWTLYRTPSSAGRSQHFIRL